MHASSRGVIPCLFALCRVVLLLHLTLVVALLVACSAGMQSQAGPSMLQESTTLIPRAKGQPVHWSGGQVNYYVDQGPLSGSVTNAQATAMVDAAAALWSAVPTAGVTLTNKGTLNEDVNGAEYSGCVAWQVRATFRRDTRSN